ncbi:tyrosine-type recombinase/integrase [Vibrio fluvialis]|uniref:tyrosine-type recombinase/integrase n=1 Tax=Vibrio fluvialis TaxID=676 RepID=UPI001303507F|nr:site-specific integrase [Vibrio fluvialis]EKO3383694.1 site-specific integrase [Vibrio fluvialis]MCG6374643.1 site-specific integrase [Vibrio fluvialis]
MKKLNNKSYPLNTVGYFIDIHLESKRNEYAPATYKSDKSRCNKIKEKIGKYNIKDMKYMDALGWMGYMHDNYKNKTINSYLSIVKSAFSIALKNKTIDDNIFSSFETLTVDDPDVNPFTKTELAKIVNFDTDRESEKNLTLIDATTGLRCSEILALTWDNVDLDKKVVYVKLANVEGIFKVPKTKGSIRAVSISDITISLLKRQYEITGNRGYETVDVLQADNKTLKKVSAKFVFINTLTNERFENIKQFQKSFFTDLLETLEIKHRGPSQLRHTYASQALSAGISKEWIACQLGHTSTQMVTKHYARWIKEDTPDFARRNDSHMADVFPDVYVESEHSSSEMPQELVHLVQKLYAKPELIAVLKALQ